jgi:Methyltransferase domain
MIKRISDGVRRRVFNFYKNNFIKAMNYSPKQLGLKKPKNYVDVITAWKGLEQVIPDIIQQFNLETNRCLEFGVDNGYSSAIFSNYFKEVIGVDYFEGDMHAGFRDVFKETSDRLKAFDNITVIKSSYQDYIKKDTHYYDMIHVDIIHTYEDTYACGLWAAQHSKCTIFHDTESFLGVRKAVRDIANDTGKTFYNYPHHFGLGIIV